MMTTWKSSIWTTSKVPDKVTEKQIAINVQVDGVWHRAFELEEQGERHIMAWEGCPLNEVQMLIPDAIDREPMILETAGSSKVCEVCYKDEIEELR